MLSNNQIKQLRALHRRKYRQKYNKFVVEGEKIALEILRHPEWPISAIYATEPWVKTHQSLLYAHLKQTITVDEKTLREVSALSTPSPIIIISDIPEHELDTAELKNNLTLFLDQIQDPGNLGTILRIADWFGVPNVCLSSGCVDLYNPKVLQASMGAFLRVKVHQLSLEELTTQTAGLPVLGAAMQGESIYTMEKPNAAIIVIGNEGNGISPELESLIHQWIHIPSGNSAGGGAESLNAGVATGIIISHLLV